MITEQKEVASPPEELTAENIIYYSEHYKKLEGVEHGSAIRTKAKKFIQLKCIEYDPEGKKYDPNDLFIPHEHKFICKPIKGYNKTVYRLAWNEKLQEFECSCQFFQQMKAQNSGFLTCSHQTALYMWLKMLNWKKYPENRHLPILKKEKKK